MVTTDNNLYHQNKVANYNLAVIVLRAFKNRYGELLPLMAETLEVLNNNLAPVMHGELIWETISLGITALFYQLPSFMSKTYQRGVGLNISVASELIITFDELGWPKEDDLFEKYCKMMQLLSSDEQGLIFDLTRDFLYFRDTQYLGAITKVISGLEVAIPSSIQNIYAAPLIKPKDVNKVKSASSAIYFLRDSLKELASRREIEIKISDRYDFLANAKDRKNTLILFIDDFVGSGETATKAINAYKSNCYVPSDTVFVIALAAQEIAVQSLASIGIHCICAYLRTRGITDSTKIADKKTALLLMGQIETRLKVSDDYLLGYHQSEALVCMLMRKCPNNTFPVFWTDGKDERTKWPAPFLRLK